MRRLAALSLLSTVALLALVLVPELPAQAQPLPEPQLQWRSPSPALPDASELELVPVEGGLRLLGVGERVELPLPELARTERPLAGNDGLHELASQRFEVEGELSLVLDELARLSRGGEIHEEPGWASLRQRRGELELELVLWQEGEGVSGEWSARRPSRQAEPPLQSPLRYAVVDGGVQVACEDEQARALMPLPPGRGPGRVTQDGQSLRLSLELEQDCGELALWAADRVEARGAELQASDLDLRWSENEVQLALATEAVGSLCVLELEARPDCGW